MLPSGVAINVVLTAISCGCFYLLLYVGTSPLAQASEYYKNLAIASAARGGNGRGRPASPGVAPEQRKLQSISSSEALSVCRHFMWASRYVWVTWHFFPLICLFGGAGLVSAQTREIMFSLCDLTAKFLPVSIYFSLLQLP